MEGGKGLHDFFGGGGMHPRCPGGLTCPLLTVCTCNKVATVRICSGRSVPQRGPARGSPLPQGGSPPTHTPQTTARAEPGASTAGLGGWAALGGSLLAQGPFAVSVCPLHPLPPRGSLLEVPPPFPALPLLCCLLPAPPGGVPWISPSPEPRSRAHHAQPRPLRPPPAPFQAGGAPPLPGCLCTTPPNPS